MTLLKKKKLIDKNSGMKITSYKCWALGFLLYHKTHLMLLKNHSKINLLYLVVELSSHAT